MPTHYQTLNVPRGATAAQIKSAFRALARTLHPDVNTARNATAAFAKVQTAYEVLSDPATRGAYDTKLRNEALPEPSLQPHYDFTNIAAPGGRAGAAKSGRTKTNAAASATPSGDPTGFDELYDTFFEPRQARKRGR